MYGCQCPKRLWLHKFQPEARDEESEDQAAIFQTGIDVGMMARQLFPYGIDASPKTAFNYQQSVVDTAQYIRNGANVIYEAAFQYDGIMAAIDILVQNNGKWYGFEVKSTSKVKEPFLLDAAFQFYVITRSGLPLEDISIVHLNTKYVRRGQLDIQQLFTATSVLKEVMPFQTFIESKSNELKAVLKLKQSPDTPVGDQCFTPYDCDFYGFCHKDLVEELTDEEETFIDHPAIRKFLKQLKYPLHFLDFETWMTAIPEQDGHWPFRQIPFQFSLHIQQKQGAELTHKCYLADGPQNSHLEFAEALLQAIESKGSVLAYNKTFENTILNHLKDEFAHLCDRIERIQERMIDLMTPFRKNYRLPAMKGSYSIKYVLPALVPELNYDSLTIGNGSDASSAFYNLKHMEHEMERNAVRNALLDYCKLDTLAMAKILEKLQGV